MKTTPKTQAFKELTLFFKMAERVPAYKRFLKHKDFDPRSVKTKADLQKVPITDKKNYIDKFSLSELCWDGKIETNSYIVNSSGSTGKPYFWPRSEASDAASSTIYGEIFTTVFHLQPGRTLFVNAYGQGSWIAGTEAFLAVLAAQKTDSSPVAINAGIDVSLILQQLATLAPDFSNIIISGYPPFVKDLLDALKQKSNIITDRHSVHIIVGGESISVQWRAHVETLLENAKHCEVISIYGMSDGGGILAHETLASKLLRQQLFSSSDALPAEITEAFGGQGNTALFQYDPALRYFRAGPEGQLLIHVKHGLPLFNYDTKDRGGVVSFQIAEDFLMGKLPSSAGISSHPFVFLLGRSDYAVTFYGLNVYPEHMRTIIDSFSDTQLTGRFLLEQHHDKNMTQELHVTVELTDDAASNVGLKKKQLKLQEYITEQLPLYTSE